MDAPVTVKLFRPRPDDGRIPWQIQTQCAHAQVHSVFTRQCPHIHVGQEEWKTCEILNPPLETINRMAALHHARTVICLCSSLVWLWAGPEHDPHLKHVPMPGRLERDSMLVHRFHPPEGEMILQRPGIDPNNPKKVYWTSRPWTPEERALMQKGDRS
jgi:hypothetical protein